MSKKNIKRECEIIRDTIAAYGPNGRTPDVAALIRNLEHSLGIIESQACSRGHGPSQAFRDGVAALTA